MSKQDSSDEGGPPLFERPLDRKAFLGLSAAGGVALVIAACGGNGNEGGSASPTPPADTTVPAGSTASATPPAVAGNTPAERAISGIKALGLPSDFTITVFSEDLSILGPEVTKDKFEQESGIKLDIQTAPFLEYAGKVFNDATTKAGTFDVVLVETNRLGDLDNAGYLVDVTDWVNKYDPDLADMVAPIGRVSSQYNGKYVGIPDDGDVFILYYRKDLMDDPKEQKAFKAKYGRDLAVPLTYDEYNDLLEFFTRPDEKLYGASEWRVKGVTYWWFWQRLWSAGGTYFTDDMSAAINSDAGVKALEDMVAMNKFMPPDVLSYGYTETLASMQNGSVFSNMTWPAAGKNANDPKTSKTAGKWGYAVMPGYVINGSPNPKSMAAPGYTVIVSNYSKKDKEACYLYTQWYTSPENLIEANKNLGGNTDIIRESVFSDPSWADLFPGAEDYVAAQKANLAIAVPDPVLPGYGEYTQALEIEISNVMTGSKSAKDALDAAAKKWDEITDAFGRDNQQQVWQAFLTAYNG
jgi:multiple sugar transport system substrate-binding protein